MNGMRATTLVIGSILIGIETEHCSTAQLHSWGNDLAINVSVLYLFWHSFAILSLSPSPFMLHMLHSYLLFNSALNSDTFECVVYSLLLLINLFVIQQLRESRPFTITMK